MVARQIEQVLAETEGVQSYTTIVGFSLLANISATYNGFYFVQLEPWGERGDRTADVIIARAERSACASCRARRRSRFPPPSIPGDRQPRAAST